MKRKIKNGNFLLFIGIIPHLHIAYRCESLRSNLPVRRELPPDGRNGVNVGAFP